MEWIVMNAVRDEWSRPIDEFSGEMWVRKTRYTKTQVAITFKYGHFWVL